MPRAFFILGDAENPPPIENQGGCKKKSPRKAGQGTQMGSESWFLPQAIAMLKYRPALRLDCMFA
ncbi:hypothetical protein OKW33_002931 [Paraburkholderia atlantica]